MPSQFKKPICKIVTQDTQLLQFLKAKLVSSGIHVLHINESLENKSGELTYRYIVLDFRYNEFDDVQIKAFQNNFDNNARIIIIFQQTQQIDKKNIEVIRELILKSNITVLYADLVVEENIKSFSNFNPDSFMNRDSVLVSTTEFFQDSVLKALLSGGLSGKRIAVGMRIAVEQDRTDSVSDFSTEFPSSLQWIDSKISVGRIKAEINSLMSATSVSESREEHDVYDNKPILVPQLTNFKEETKTTPEVKEIKSEIQKEKKLMRKGLYIVLGFIVFPFAHTIVVLILALFVKFVTPDVSFLGNLASSLYLVNVRALSSYTQLLQRHQPFALVYSPLADISSVLELDVSLESSKRNLLAFIPQIVSDGTVVPETIEAIAQEGSYFSRLLDHTKTEKVSPLQQSIANIFLKDYLLNRDQYELFAATAAFFSHVVNGETKGDLAIVVTDSDRPLGYANTIKDIYIYQYPYDDKNYYQIDRDKLNATNTTGGQIDAPAVTSLLTGESYLPLSNTFWSTDATKATNLGINYIEQLIAAPIGSMVVINDTALHELTNDQYSSGSFALSTLLASLSTQSESFLEYLKKEDIVLWVNDQELQQKIHSTFQEPQLVCTECSTDIFGSFVSAEGSVVIENQHLKVSHEEKVTKYTYMETVKNTNNASTIVLSRIIVPLNSSVGVVSTQKSNQNSVDQYPTIENDANNKAIMALTALESGHSISISYSWEVASTEGQEYQLIVYKQPSIIDHNLSITFQPNKPISALTDFVLTEEGNYTYNTLLRDDIVLHVGM
jgi:hypothetical protein